MICDKVISSITLVVLWQFSCPDLAKVGLAMQYCSILC